MAAAADPALPSGVHRPCSAEGQEHGSSSMEHPKNSPHKQASMCTFCSVSAGATLGAKTRGQSGMDIARPVMPACPYPPMWEPTPQSPSLCGSHQPPSWVAQGNGWCRRHRSSPSQTVSQGTPE